MTLLPSKRYVDIYVDQSFLVNMSIIVETAYLKKLPLVEAEMIQYTILTNIAYVTFTSCIFCEHNIYILWHHIEIYTITKNVNMKKNVKKEVDM